MSKIIRRILMFVCVFCLVSCSVNTGNNEVKNFHGKEFEGTNGGKIVILEKSLAYSGESANIKANSNPEDVNKNIDKQKKSNASLYKNPKVVEKNGKKYLTADNFEYKLLIVDENTILDEDDNYEFKFTKNTFDK